MASPTSQDQEVVTVSESAFAVWWLVFLGVHLITCGYNAVYALLYWALRGTVLSQNLEHFQVGMPSSHYGVITAVHSIKSSLHGFCVLLMVGSSLYLRIPDFTPWGGSALKTEQVRRKSKATYSTERYHNRFSISMIRKNLSKLTTSLSSRSSILLSRGQAYRMSFFLPRMLLNRFYVVGLVLNCWSSAIIYTLPFRQDEARRRFANLVCDCALDLMSCMGVEVIVMLSYVDQYDPETTDFGANPWYNDEWTTRALNEFQMVAVVSWSDLFSRCVFSLGLLMTSTNLKELMDRREKTPGNRVAIASDTAMVISKRVKVKAKFDRDAVEKEAMKSSMAHSTNKPHNIVIANSMRRRIWLGLMNGVHLLFFLWGLLILVFHIQASVQTSLPQCMLQVRPWAMSRPSCFLLCLDCYRLGVSGYSEEVSVNWHEFDGSTVAMILIRHCPALEVPNIFNEFHGLRSIKVYNSTIVKWQESVAITNKNHPKLLSLMLVRVNMTDGVLPAGFVSSDIRSNLYDIELCVTNLREVPDDLDTKWFLGSCIVIEYSQLRRVPASLLRMMPSYLSLMGNPISTYHPRSSRLKE